MKSIIYAFNQVVSIPVIIILLVFTDLKVSSQNPVKTFDPGAYVIDMGQATQTIANGLKPYGLVYRLITDCVTPVNWAINSSKAKDGIDFTAGGKNYKGGSFIIEADRITSSVLTLINTWKAKGVVVDGPIISSFTAPVYKELTSWPVAALDAANDFLITPYYTNAEIPSSTYILNANPTYLTGCTGGDMYVLPHADPDQWPLVYITTLQTYINNGGYLWSGCHAVSVLENISGCNFLTNNMVLYGSHSDPSPPYTYNTASNDYPIMQFMGTLDGATTNGSERIFVPGTSYWRSTTTLAVYDANYKNTIPNPDVFYVFPNAATIIAYGKAFGDTTKGIVMYEAGHNLENGTVAERVAAQRVYFNFLLMVGAKKHLNVDITNLPAFYTPGATYTLNSTVTGGTGPYTYLWSSIGGGTFSSTTTSSTNFTAPAFGNVIITLKVTDACGKVNFVPKKSKPANPLPVELLSFNANCEGNNVNLSWTTASETNNDYFVLERSINGQNWNFLAKIDGAGNSNEVRSYQYTDEIPFPTLSYYRLKQVDFDGKSVTFDPVFSNCADLTNNLFEIVAISFNETNNMLTMSYNLSEDCNVKVYLFDVIGQKIASIDKESEAGMNTKTISFGNSLPVGFYMVTLKANNKIITKKILLH